jgi:hypothetical protein
VHGVRATGGGGLANARTPRTTSSISDAATFSRPPSWPRTSAPTPRCRQPTASTGCCRRWRSCGTGVGTPRASQMWSHC